MAKTQILGILNLTSDSFSDGGRYLEPAAAIEHGLKLAEHGADVIDLGPASSHPDASKVSAQVEIERLEPVVAHLRQAGVAMSIDSWQPQTQHWALAQGVGMLNDIQGFPAPSAELARGSARLVVMHSLRKEAKADRSETQAPQVLRQMFAFFAERIASLIAVGVARERIILDPGLGYFVGSTPAPSLAILRALPELRLRFGLEVLVSASRKSFLGAVTGRSVGERCAATLAAELYASRNGAGWVRTHDPRALRDGLAIEYAISTAP